VRKLMLATRWVATAALVCTMSSIRGARAAPTDGATTAKAKLTSVPLSAPHAVLSKPDANSIRLLNDLVFSGTQLQFNSENATAECSLAGTKLKFSVIDNQGFKLTYDGKAVTLQRDEMSFKPAKLRLGNDRSYVLAFPYGYVYQFQAQPGQAQQTQGMLMLRSGNGQYFSLDGQSFCLFDSNTDGYYRLSEDAIGIGKSGGTFNVFAPLGRLLATSKGVYEITRLAEDGSELEYTPFTGPTAKLSTAVAETDLEIGVAFGSSEAGLNFAVPINSTRAADLKVVPGKYNLLYGLVYSPAMKKLVATVGPGKLPAADVSGDKASAIKLGGPFELEYTLQTTGRQMTVASNTFHLRGKNGEEYANFAWAAEPEISLTVGGKTTALGKMEFG
jgi:hypothetical protein